MANLEHPPEAKLSGDVSHALRIAAIALRTLFIVLLVVLTLRVSLPQSETIWTAYDTPADLVRLILGRRCVHMARLPALSGAERRRQLPHLVLSRPRRGAVCLDRAIRGVVTERHFRRLIDIKIIRSGTSAENFCGVRAGNLGP